MKQNNWMKFKKALAILLVATITMAATVVTTLANEVQELQISQWSIPSLNEGERYGIFPTTWYYEDFQKPITPEKLQVLLENVNKRLENLGLEVDSSFKPEAVGTGVTRGEVITLLYNELGKYKVPTGTQLSESTAVEYFQKKGILKGTGKGLELDQPCTVEQATVLAILLIEDSYNSAQVGGKGFFWKATHGDNTIYLLGSIHIGDSAMYPLRQQVKDAFKESDALIVEALVNEESVNEYIKIARYDDNTTLKDHVSEETYNKVLEVLEKLGLPAEGFIVCKPWSVANDLVTISSSHSNSIEGALVAQSLGIDLYFMSKAQVTGKPIYELEGLKHHAELFDGLSAQLQEDQLVEVLDSILSPEPTDAQAIREAMALLQRQWYEGDVVGILDGFEAITNDSESEFSKMLLGKRDKDMADKLAKLLDREGKATYFVVVGSAHLVVEDMIIDQLKDKGYNVEFFK